MYLRAFLAIRYLVWAPSLPHRNAWKTLTANIKTPQMNLTLTQRVTVKGNL